MKTNRKEWLEKKIQELEDRSLWDELPEIDKIFLDSYWLEYELIVEREENENKA